ncbi:MAG TPA: amidohydrolase family protein, partial [Stellaceae bacterium]|nr:amidohydrolase family protein [Stellaceae bacterium]
MAYDVLIKNGRIVDGSGLPAFNGDVAVKDGKIAEIGKLSGAADQVVDVGGQVIAPGFIDNHCHYDAQVTWDPLCSFSCDHGATSVVIGNCSLSLAPVRKGREKRMAEFLSYVEAIPMDVLGTVEVDWESFPQYMERLDSNLGVNVGTLMGHTAIRYYVMDEDCQSRDATDDELKKMQQLVREGMDAGALGLSVSRNKGHYDPQGVHIPALWADEKEIFALAEVLGEMGTGIIQSGGGREAEMDSGLMARLAEATGRPVVYNNLGQSVRRPGQWKTHMDRVNETVAKGIRAYPLCSPNRTTQTFNMSNSQLWRGSPTWHPILISSDEEKLKAYADPEVRRKLHEEMVEGTVVIPGGTIAKDWWNYIWVHEPVLEKNKWMIEKSLKEVADAQGKGIIDSFL